MPMCHYLEQHIFQSTPPRGRRLRCRVGCAVLIVISIHASAREATRGLSRQSSSGLHFNPRLREGGDRDAQGNIRKLLLISIHASAREATLPMMDFCTDTSFQSTPPRGRRRKNGFLADNAYISIHASAREATFNASFISIRV